MTATPTYAEALVRIARRLEARAGASATAEAERILITAARRMSGAPNAGTQAGREPSRLQIYSRTEIPSEVMAEADRMAGERAAGRLLQHITGVQGFLDHEYQVNASVLIPRPETEILAQIAIETLRDRRPVQGLEIGLGSGVLSIELLAACPSLQMTASELMPEAAAVASENAATILSEHASRLRVVLANSERDVWKPFGQVRADFLVSNPPYLKREEADADVAACEPPQALWAPIDDALFFYRAIAERAGEFLGPDGLVFLEVPPERAAQIMGLFSGEWQVELKRDLNDRERVLAARLRAKA